MSIDVFDQISDVYDESFSWKCLWKENHDYDIDFHYCCQYSTTENI